MKRIALLATAASSLLAFGPAWADTSANGARFTNMACTVYFSPGGGAQQVIIGAIAGARTNIRMAAYEITVQRIADALIAAKKRGVDVRIIVDETESRASYSKASYLAAAGLDVSYDPAVLIHHNKFLTVDGFELLTGSYNYSANAEMTNAENMLACHSSAAAAAYNSYWSQVRLRTVGIAAAAAR